MKCEYLLYTSYTRVIHAHAPASVLATARDPLVIFVFVVVAMVLWYKVYVKFIKGNVLHNSQYPQEYVAG